MKRKYGSGRFALGLALVALVFAPARRAQAQWVTDGVPASALSGVQGRPASVSDGGGGVIVAWQNGAGSSGDIHAQRLSPSGEPLWGPDGVPVCTASNLQYEPLIVASGSGGAIIAWTDLRGANGNVFAQRLNAFGDPMWSVSGVSLTGAAGLQRATAIVTDRSDGAIVVWDDYRSGESDIYGRRIDANGNLGWGANGAALCVASGHQRNAAMVSLSGAGDVVAVWEDERGSDVDVYAQRVLVGGSLMWGTNGAAVCTASDAQESPSIVAGAGGAYIVWTDSRNAGEPDIYAQGMNSGGTALWTANGVGVCTQSGKQIFPRLVVDEGLSVLVATWDDARLSLDDIYAQRLNIGSGAPMWPTNGVALCAASGEQVRSMPVMSGGGSVVAAWTDGRVGVDVYAQAIDSTGAVVFATDGVALCSASADQDSVALVATTDGAVIAAWTDARSGGSRVHAQRLSAGGRPGFDHAVVASPGSGGKIVPGGSVLVNTGPHSFLLAPNAYSRVQDVRVDGTSVGAPLGHTPYIGSDRTLSASFATDEASAYAGWLSGGVPVATGFGMQDQTTMAPDGVGGVVLAWRDSRNAGADARTDIYAQRFGPSGQPMWTAGGVPVCTASRDQYAPNLASDGAGGALIVWEEPNRGTGTGADVYAQRLDANGVAQWTANGIGVATSGSTEQSPVVAPDGAGGGVVAWIDWRSGQGRVYAQRLAVSGVARWTVGGIRVALDEGNDASPLAVPDGEGGAIVGWTNLPDSIFVARVDSTGIAQWQTRPSLAAFNPEPSWRLAPDIAGVRS